MEDIVLVGFGGHAKSIIDCIKRQNKYRIVGYTDLYDKNCEYTYLGTDEVLIQLYKNGIKNAVICVGYLGKDNVREVLFNRLKVIGYSLPVISDPSAIISSSSIIDEATFIGKNVVINAETKIGKCCIINTGVIIEHECIVGDFSHIAVGSILCGQVEIGKSCFIGANATIIQCRKIPNSCIVPAGEVIR